jgi:mRNA interferase MazF
VTTTPRRGDIWLVNLDPTVGSEIKKTRPAVIISSNLVGTLPLKLVVPVTDWKDYFTANLWHIYLEPTTENGLTKISAADVFQLRSVDTRRFVRKLGTLPLTEIQDIAIAIALLVEYQESLDL